MEGVELLPVKKKERSKQKSKQGEEDLLFLMHKRMYNLSNI